jgi:hypothetical protein
MTTNNRCIAKILLSVFCLTIFQSVTFTPLTFAHGPCADEDAAVKDAQREVTRTKKALKALEDEGPMDDMAAHMAI